MKSSRGFTLIELLVVIALIGILASVILVSLNSARAKARDAIRLQDANTIQTILDAYYSSNGAYPAAPNNSYWTDAGAPPSSQWSALEALVGQPLPVDPLSNTGGRYYDYYPFWTNGTAGAGNCYGHTILRMPGGMESRPQVQQCNEQYGGSGVSDFLIQ